MSGTRARDLAHPKHRLFSSPQGLLPAFVGIQILVFLAGWYMGRRGWQQARTKPLDGKIYLVGAGLGDREHLTTEAYRVLTEKVSLVISDRLIPKSVRQLIVDAGAEVRVARKVPGRADAAQEEIFTWAKEALDCGRSVARLKIGDPFLLGRGGEEVLRFRKLGYEAQVLPGLSSALVAPLLAGIPVTHRGVANQVLIATGRDKGGALPHMPTYHAKRTLVLLMAVGRLSTLHADLLPLAYPSSLPLAVIENAALPTQRITRSTLADAASLVGAVQAPAVLVLGNVVEAL